MQDSVFGVGSLTSKVEGCPVAPGVKPNPERVNEHVPHGRIGVLDEHVERGRIARPTRCRIDVFLKLLGRFSGHCNTALRPPRRCPFRLRGFGGNHHGGPVASRPQGCGEPRNAGADNENVSRRTRHAVGKIH